MKKSIKIILIIVLVILLVLGGLFLKNNNVIKKSNNSEKKEEKVKEDKEDITLDEKTKFVSSNGWLKVENNTLVNQNGNKFQLRGISTHGIQWYGNYANESMMKSLKENFNINLFRIAMYTEENGYIQNRDLKNKVDEIVNFAIKLDMYVIIDWHILSDGNPNMHKEEAREFFDEMSLKYKEYPNVIYEICNEPNGNVTWDNDIKPYADEVISVIRKNSKNSIIIVGTPTWSQEVDKVINNKIDDKNVMYALHFYTGTHKEWLRDRAKEALSSIPIFVSEWGVSDASGNGGIYLEEADKWVSFMNENNISYSVWSLCDKNESSALLKEGAPVEYIDESNLSSAGTYIRNIIKN